MPSQIHSRILLDGNLDTTESLSFRSRSVKKIPAPTAHDKHVNARALYAIACWLFHADVMKKTSVATSKYVMAIVKTRTAKLCFLLEFFVSDGCSSWGFFTTSVTAISTSDDAMLLNSRSHHEIQGWYEFINYYQLFVSSVWQRTGTLISRFTPAFLCQHIIRESWWSNW